LLILFFGDRYLGVPKGNFGSRKIVTIYLILCKKGARLDQ